VRWPVLVEGEPAACRGSVLIEVLAERRAQRPLLGQDLEAMDPRHEHRHGDERLRLPEVEGVGQQRQRVGEVDGIARDAVDARPYQRSGPPRPDGREGGPGLEQRHDGEDDDHVRDRTNPGDQRREPYRPG
jgi:hypothetical protein